MTQKTVDRLGVVQQVVDRQLRQKEAARQLDLSVRQIKRLVVRYRAEGAAGLVSRHRGRRPNNQIADALRQEILDLVRSRYAERQWMIADDLWKPKARKQARIHQRRPRRPCRGELVQIDGSPHDWFEDRGPRCALIVFIDDATSELMALRFAPAETTQSYMETLRGYLAEHGRPVALYPDKHSIFRVNHPDREGELTQFTRAPRTLDIEPIHAHCCPIKEAQKRPENRLVLIQ